MATTIDLGKIRLQWKGDYSNATSYELLDVVKFKGDSYVFISTIAAANKTPDTTSEWDLMVSGGDQWSTGTSVPTGGNPGDMYLKTDDEKVYTNIAGSWGVVGDMGGSRWTSGTSAPSGGEDGDFYLKTDDEKVYERVSGSWAVKLDIGGGVWTSSTSNGSGGESGDWHINTTTKDIQENVSGTWTTRVNLSVSGTNLSDLANVPALDSGKFLTNDGTTASWATVDVAGASVGGDVSGTVSNIQIAAGAVNTTELAANAVSAAKIDNSAVTNEKISSMAASKLTGALPAIDGSALTGIASTPFFSNINTTQISTSTMGHTVVTIVDLTGLVLDQTKYKYFMRCKTAMHIDNPNNGANLGVSYRVNQGAWVNLGQMSHRFYFTDDNRYGDIGVDVVLPTAATGNIELRFTGGNYINGSVYFNYSSGGYGYGSITLTGELR